MGPVRGNSVFPECILREEHLNKALDTNKKVSDMHQMFQTLLENTEHLQKLDCLERIEDKLIAPATSENRIEKTFAVLIVKILGGALIMAVLCIAFLLTGENFGIIGALHR